MGREGRRAGGGTRRRRCGGYGDIGRFSRGLLPRQALRPYQLEAARAIVDSVLGRRGHQFAIVFARQAGKDETLAQLLAFLLNVHQRAGGSIVVAAPTFRPQSAIGRARLLDRLDNPLNRLPGCRPEERSGYIVGLGRASARFLSAGPAASARGETASLLLVANEAQDILPDRWDAVFDPMAASTNATTVFSGTVWSDRTLLARQMRHLRALERADGLRRVFLVPWTRVAEDLPAYGERVRARIAQFGRDHPFIRSEYDLQEIAGAGGLFGPARRAQLAGDHPRQRRPASGGGRHYALLIDVGGEEGDAGAPTDPDEGATLRAGGTRRDSTALTVVEVLPPAREPGGAPRGARCRPTGWWTGGSGPGRATATSAPRLSTWRGSSGGRGRSWWTPPGSARGWPRSSGRRSARRW